MWYEAKKKRKKSDREKFNEQHGIVPEKAKPSHNACSIGFSEKEKAWWGWSHRARSSFEVGSEVKEGDVVEGSFPIGFKEKTLKDAEKMARAFAEAVS